MEEAVRLDLDKLPIKRLEAIDEAGSEHYPPDTSSEEQRLAAIRRIDFSWVIEKDAKKAKKAAKDTAQQAWPWQGLTESLQQAQQELSVVIDLIGTVEANDAVAVATTQKPKSLPNETLVDMAVSAATKLQRVRHLARYFKQSAKTMEQQFQKEARFYGSLIRLQQNWKVKKQRFGGSGPGSEGFMFDLVDSSQLDTAAMPRLSSLSLVPIDQDSSGTLSVQVPQKACRFLSLQFRGDSASGVESCARKMKEGISSITSSATENDALENDDVNKSVKHTHSILRNIHKSILEEQPEKWDLEKCIAMCVQEEERFKSSHGGSINYVKDNKKKNFNSNFSSKNKGKAHVHQPQQNKFAVDKDQCLHCKKTGHYKKDCPDYLKMIMAKKGIPFDEDYAKKRKMR